MNLIEVENKLNAQNYIEHGMIEAAFEFWFNDNGHIRSPFPLYIREELKLKATSDFLDWSSKLSEKAKKDINDEILAEKLEEVVFEIATELVLTEDEKLTVKYPFMIKVDDIVKAKEDAIAKADSKVIDRMVIKRGDFTFLKVKLSNTVTGEIWETEFELQEA